MGSKAAFARLRKELSRLLKSPAEHIEAAPLEANILEWHYVITGPPDSVYAGGFYWGKLVFPPQYPFKPPSIQMTTPSGRFKTDTRLCLSMSDYHPETWNPMWSVSSILSGLLSFMLESTPTQGSVESSDETKREFARRSLAHNVKSPLFRKMFPKYVEWAATGVPAAIVAKKAADPPRIEQSASAPAPATTQTPTATPAAATGSDLATPPEAAAPPRPVAPLPVDDDDDDVIVEAVNFNRGFDFIGGFMRIREESMYDLIATIVVILSVVFAALYFK